jgi:chromosome partitioning protein
MKVIVLANRKGGVAKTTLTGHLAVAAELAGDGPVAVIDTDPQASLAKWWDGRAAETPVFINATLNDLKGQLAILADNGFRYAFIDTEGSFKAEIGWVIDTADLVLMPVKPSPHDLRAIGETVDQVAEKQKPFAFVLTQAKQTAILTVQAMAALSAHGVVSPAIMHDRVDWASSMTDGRTVLETDASGRSAAEVRDLWNFVKSRINASTQSRKAAAA